MINFKHLSFALYSGIFLILVISFAAEAQRAPCDYIITRKGDTIKCTISKNIFSGLRYRVSSKDDYKAVDVNEINEYYTYQNNETFRAFKIPETDKVTFLELLESGKIDLYELKSRHYRSNNIFWFAAKNDNKLIEIKNTLILHPTNADKENLIKLISNNVAAVQKINGDKAYSFKNIKDAIHQYNAPTGRK
ncbi:MAG: hypothetical protein ACHQF4_09450 [Sphingobacteriales bacterium]